MALNEYKIRQLQNETSVCLSQDLLSTYEQYHRVIESLMLEKTSKIIQSNCPPTTNIAQ